MSFYYVTILFGKSEEAALSFASLEKYADVSLKKLVFINVAPSDGITGQDNVEVFKQYAKPGDRCFLCNGNYFTTPYRYAAMQLIPSNVEFSIYSESDIWLEGATDYFSKGLAHIKKNDKVSMISMLTRYTTPELAQKLDPYSGYVSVRKHTWNAKANLLWHFVIVRNDMLRNFYLGKGIRQRELSDGRFAAYCWRWKKQTLVADGRMYCVHLDDIATADKYPVYKKYYTNQTPELRTKMKKRFASPFRKFDETSFVEI